MQKVFSIIHCAEFILIYHCGIVAIQLAYYIIIILKYLNRYSNLNFLFSWDDLGSFPLLCITAALKPNEKYRRCFVSLIFKSQLSYFFYVTAEQVDYYFLIVFSPIYANGFITSRYQQEDLIISVVREMYQRYDF